SQYGCAVLPVGAPLCFVGEGIGAGDFVLIEYCAHDTSWYLRVCELSKRGFLGITIYPISPIKKYRQAGQNDTFALRSGSELSPKRRRIMQSCAERQTLVLKPAPPSHSSMRAWRAGTGSRLTSGVVRSTLACTPVVDVRSATPVSPYH